MVTWRLGPPLPAACALPAACVKLAFCSKTLHSGLLAAQTASGGPDGLQTGFLSPQRPPDGPGGLPVAPGGLRKVLLAPKTTSGRASWRPRRPPDGPLGAKRAFDAYAFLSSPPRLHDDFLDRTSARSTWLQLNFAACRLASSIYIDGVTLVHHFRRNGDAKT